MSTSFRRCALSCALLAGAASAQTFSVTGPGTAVAEIPLGTTSAWPGGALPSGTPSPPVVVPPHATSITSVTITGLAHTWSGDVQMILVDPFGGMYNLIHRNGFTGVGFGASNDFGGTYVIADGGGVMSTAISPIPSGTYAPAFGVGGGTWPSGTHGVVNSPIGAIPPIPGPWILLAVDWAGGDVGAYASWTLSGTTSGDSYNVDIDDGAGAGAGLPAAPYGAVGAAGAWNGVASLAAGTPLFNTAGIATGASVTITSTLGHGPYSFDNPLTLGDDHLLLDDVLDPGSAANVVTVTVSGLVDGAYSVIMYGFGPDIATFGATLTDFTLTGGGAGTQTCGGADWVGNHVYGSTYVSDTTLVAGGTLSFTLASPVTTFGNCNGFQLLRTEPAASFCYAGGSINGCFPSISGAGVPSIGAGSGYLVTMSGADGLRLGGMFYGLLPANLPFGTGTARVCNLGPRQRLGPSALSGGTFGACDGGFGSDLMLFLATHPGAIGQPFAAGDTLYVQGWNRDSGNGSANISTSDAIAVTLDP